MSYIGMKELEQTPVVPSKGMKGPLSYDNCKGCKSQCEHAGKDRTFCYRDKSCKVTVVTNADRIRAMSDEELSLKSSTLFVKACKCEDPSQCTREEWIGNYSPCCQCVLEWLKQPVGGE